MDGFNSSTSMTSRNTSHGIPETIVGSTYLNRVMERYSSLAIHKSAKADNNSFPLYPEPSAGIVYIESGEATIESIKLYDALGQVTQSWTTSSTKLELNLKDFERGIYSVIIQTDKGQLQQQTILE